MKRAWLAPLAAFAIAAPLPGSAASTMASFAFDLSYDATTSRLLGVNGFWQDPIAAPSATGRRAFVELIGHGNDPFTPITMTGSSTSTVDEPLVPLLVAVGALAFVIEHRRVQARSGRIRPADPAIPCGGERRDSAHARRARAEAIHDGSA